MNPFNNLSVHWPGVIGYALLLAIVGALLYFGVGPKDLETMALVGILSAAVPSMAVKPALSSLPIPPESGSVQLLAGAEVKPAPETKK